MDFLHTLCLVVFLVVDLVFVRIMYVLVCLRLWVWQWRSNIWIFPVLQTSALFNFFHGGSTYSHKVSQSSLWLEHHTHSLTFTTMILGINLLCCPIFSCCWITTRRKGECFMFFHHSDQRRYAWVHPHHWLKYSNHLLHNWVLQNRLDTVEVNKIFMNFLIGKYESAGKVNRG